MDGSGWGREAHRARAAAAQQKDAEQVEDCQDDSVALCHDTAVLSVSPQPFGLL